MAFHIALRRAEECITDDDDGSAEEEEEVEVDFVDVDAPVTVDEHGFVDDNDNAASAEDVVEDAGINRFFLGFKMLPLESRGKICRTSFSDASLDNSPDCS